MNPRGRVQIADVSFAYPDGTRVLEHVNLELSAGDLVALIGRNGSGKTTLAKLIAGILRPGRGTVRIDGLPTFQGRLRRPGLVEQVGYVFQNPDHQLFSSTVRQEIAYGLERLKLAPGEIAARIDHAAAIAGVPASLFDEHPFFLPKGIRQRVAIASILALEPAVLIVDEPTTGQDWAQSLDVMEFLVRLNRDGHTIIIVTHEMEIVARYARRVIGMAEGEVLLDAPTATAFADAGLLGRLAVEAPAAEVLAPVLADRGLGAVRNAQAVMALLERRLAPRTPSP